MDTNVHEHEAMYRLFCCGSCELLSRMQSAIAVCQCLPVAGCIVVSAECCCGNHGQTVVVAIMGRLHAAKVCTCSQQEVVTSAGLVSLMQPTPFAGARQGQ